jgi:hypothetical protein
MMYQFYRILNGCDSNLFVTTTENLNEKSLRSIEIPCSLFIETFFFISATAAAGNTVAAAVVVAAAAVAAAAAAAIAATATGEATTEVAAVEEVADTAAVAAVGFMTIILLYLNSSSCSESTCVFH